MLRLLPGSTLFPYTTLFRSMWPPEGSVSPEVAEIAARAGVRWLATDEEVLWRSLPPELRRRRSEEHTSELQSQFHLVCRLLLEKKNTYIRFKKQHYSNT